MNLREASVAIRSRTTLEAMDLAFPFILRLGRGTYGWLAFFLFGPSVAGLMALRHYGGWSWLAVWCCAVVLAGLLQGAFTLAAGELMFTAAARPGAICGQFLRSLPRYVVVLLIGRGLMALSALTIVLLPFVWARQLFLNEAALLERLRKGALHRSQRLTEEDGGFSVAMSCVGMSLLGIALAELLGWGVVSYVFELGEPFGSLWNDGGSVFSLLGLFASVPFLATARFFVYVDRRTRRDGWDVQVRFQRIVASWEAPA